MNIKELNEKVRNNQKEELEKKIEEIEEGIVINSMCTDLFKSMIEETNLEEETIITVRKIENMIEELISQINDKIGDKKEKM